MNTFYHNTENVRWMTGTIIEIASNSFNSNKMEFFFDIILLQNQKIKRKKLRTIVLSHNVLYVVAHLVS